MAPGTAADLALVAGEASGDLLGGLLLEGLAARWPHLRSEGVGGARMQAQGQKVLAPMERLSVFGYADAIRRLPELLWLRGRLGRRWQGGAHRPRAFVGIDAPDFNLGLERRLRARGVPTVHMVCPSIWAWRAERIDVLRASCDLVLCLFPFEPPLLARAGIESVFIGHPLAERLPMEPPRAAARAALGIADEVPLVALLPGSRASEIRAIAPTLLDAALRLHSARPELRFVLPAAPGHAAALDALLAERPVLRDAGVLQRLDGRSHDAMAAADVGIVASGTATLEAMLLKMPMTIVYRMAEGTWRRLAKMRLQPWVGLPNVLAGRFVVPERLQHDATPERLADDTLQWLDDHARRETFAVYARSMHEALHQPTAQRAADAMARWLAPGPAA